MIQCFALEHKVSIFYVQRSTPLFYHAHSLHPHANTSDLVVCTHRSFAGLTLLVKKLTWLWGRTLLHRRNYTCKNPFSKDRFIPLGRDSELSLQNNPFASVNSFLCKWERKIMVRKLCHANLRKYWQAHHGFCAGGRVIIFRLIG